MKELLNEEKENPKWKEHTLLLSLAAVDLRNGKDSSRDVGGHIYRPAREASHGKSFHEK
jgi:hypothetical protein